jgi:hypothetical protein
LQVLAPVQRQFHDAPVLNDRSQFRGFRLQHRRPALHLDGFGDVAHLQCEVDLVGLPNL